MIRVVCIGISCLLVFSWAASCSGEKKEDVPGGMEGQESPVIGIDQVKVILPQAGNVELVEMYCVPCHSLRYIEMQPRMTRKSWEKIVDKMIHAYGAPVRDSVTRTDIINYLWAIKRKEE